MKKRLYIVTLIVALILSLLTVTVNAADDEFKVTLESSESSVSKGSEVTVTINVSDFEDNVEKGINRVSGTLKFDDEVFESITSDDISSSWKVSYDEDTGDLEFTTIKPITRGQDIAEITLKAKNNTTSTEGLIELSDLTASDSDVELKADDASVEIAIAAASATRTTNRISSTNTNTNTNRIRNLTTNTNTEKDDEEDDDENTNTTRNIRANTSTNNTNTSRNINTNTNQNTNNEVSENKSTEEEMPNTGLDDSIVKAILLVALIGLFGYIKIKSLDRK